MNWMTTEELRAHRRNLVQSIELLKSRRATWDATVSKIGEQTLRNLSEQLQAVDAELTMACTR